MFSRSLNFLSATSIFFLGSVGISIADSVDDCLAYREDAKKMIEICTDATRQRIPNAQTKSEVHDYLGYAFQQDGQRDEALKHFNLSIETWSENPAAWEDLGWLHWEYESYAEALTAFDKAFDLSPTAARLSGKASALSYIGDSYLEALELIQAAQAMDPEYVWAVSEEGWMHVRQDEYGLAKDLFKRLVNSHPDDAWHHLGLSMAESGLDDFEAARAAIDNALAIEPNHPRFLVETAYIVRLQGDAADALEISDQVLGIEPLNDNALVQKSFALFDLGRNDEAIEVMRYGWENYPTSPYMIDRYIELLEDMERNDLLIELHKELVEIVPDNADYFIDLSYYYHEVDDAEGAKEAAQQAVRLAPEDPLGHYNLAYALVDLHENDAAYDAIEAAVNAGLEKEDLGEFVTYVFGSGKMALGLKTSRLAFE